MATRVRLLAEVRLTQTNEVISMRFLCEPSVFVMYEGECGFGEGSDLLGLAVIWRRMRQRPTSTANPRSPSAAQTAQQGVVRAVVHMQIAAVGGVFDRGVHADTGSVVAAVGEGGQAPDGRRPNTTNPGHAHERR